MTRRRIGVIVSALSLACVSYAGARAYGQRARSSARPPALVGLAHPQSLWVVGAYDAKMGWLPEERAHALFKSGSRFSACDERGTIRTVTIRRIESGEEVGGYFAETREKLADAPRVALHGAGNPIVRRPRVQSLANPLYQEAAAAVLKAKGLSLARARLTQHLRVDLNGDGREEVLLCARSRPGVGNDIRVEAGDYSLAALRFVSGGKPVTIPLEIEAYPRKQPDGSIAMQSYKVIGCADVNGDGRMEIFLYSRYYEGDGMAVFTFDGKAARRVLHAGWGV